LKQLGFITLAANTEVNCIPFLLWQETKVGYLCLTTPPTKVSLMNYSRSIVYSCHKFVLDDCQEHPLTFIINTVLFGCFLAFDCTSYGLCWSLLWTMLEPLVFVLAGLVMLCVNMQLVLCFVSFYE